MAVTGKKTFAKVYDSAGVFVTTLDPINYDSLEEKINVGYGPATFSFPAVLGNYGEGSAIWYNNIVELYVVDIDSGSDGLKVYSGYISDYQESAEGSSQTVTVNLLSFSIQTANTPAVISSNTLVKTSGSGNALQSITGNASAREVADVVKKAIDLLQANNTAPKVNYATGSVDTTAITMTYTWAAQTVKQILDDCMSFLGNAFYWRIGADNVFYLKPKPTTADWLLVLGNDFTNYKAEKSTADIINRIIFDNGDAVPSICREYKDDTSRGKYGDHFKFVTDNRIIDTTTADTKMNALLEQYANPSRRITFDVLDNNYTDDGRGVDIDTMYVGQTVNLRGLDELNAGSIPDNLQIVSIKKYLDFATVELELVSYSPNYLAVKTAEKVAEIGSRGANTAIGTETYAPDTGDIKASLHTADHQDQDGRWWLKLDGSNRSRTTYAALFALIGTTYGSGDGSTTFGTPDLRDRNIVGVSGTKSLGTTGGIASINFSHTHRWLITGANKGDWSTWNSGGSTVQIATGNAGNNGGAITDLMMDGVGGSNTSYYTESGLGSSTIQNPYFAANYFVKV